MNRVVISIFGIFLLLSSSVLAGDFEPGSEPEGFRGIEWGTEIGSLSGLTLLRREPRFGGLDVYSREGEKLSAWGAPVGAIEYFFRKEKFFRGSVLTTGVEDYQNFRKAVFEKYGVGDLQPQAAPGVTQFSWQGTITSVILQFEAATESGSLLITSRKIEDRIMEEAVSP